jgi:hypothetical protein
MYTKTSATIVIVIIATIALVLMTAASFSTNPVLAWSHGRKNANSQNDIADTSNASATSKVDLKKLLTCISNGANGPNRLTQNELVNCYMQSLPASNPTTASSSSVGPNLSNGNNSPIETSDSG